MPGASRLGDKANVMPDAHGCPACPHPGLGPAIQGSPDVNVNKRPAIRLDDPGLHTACCGTNQWNTMQGSQTVFVNGKPATRMGDQTKHCGGIGRMIEGSQNVIVGGPPGMGSSGGAGGGGGGGGGPGGSPAGGSAAARASSSGGGGGGSGAGAGRAGGGGAGSGTAGGGAASAGAAAGGANASANPEDAKKAAPADDKVFVVSAELKTPGGVALAFEQVVLVKRGTTEVVAGPVTTDADGKFATVVPEQVAYDIQVLDDGSEHHQAPAADDVNATHLHCQFFAGGAPAAGELVTIRGEGLQLAATLGEHGELDLAVPPGAYELTVLKQSFKAHTLCAADLQADGDGDGEHHQFVIENEVDWAAHERARADRYSPNDRDAPELA